MAADPITILCVDDEEIPRTLRALVLKKQGYHVITAASGPEALKLLDRNGVDLVLTDQMMPTMCGTELAKRAKIIRPGLPVILISGMNELPEDAVTADRFVSKVEGPEPLIKAILEVLKESRQKN